MGGIIPNTAGQVPLIGIYPSMTKSEEDALLRRHDKLIRHLAHTLHEPGADFDDLLQEGRVAFVVAARKWRDGEGGTVWTFAARAVRWAMLLLLRGARRRSVEQPAEVELADERSDPESLLLVREVVDFVSSLSQEQQRLVAGRLVQDMTVRELADVLGVSKSVVDERWHTAVAALRKRAA